MAKWRRRYFIDNKQQRFQHQQPKSWLAMRQLAASTQLTFLNIVLDLQN